MNRRRRKHEYDLENALSPTDYTAVHVIKSTNGATLANPGSSCGRVPRVDLGWLVEGGHIQLKSRLPVGA